MKNIMLIFLLSISMLDVAGQYKKAYKTYEEGVAAFESKDFILADSLFRESLKISPSDQICMKIATLYLQGNDTRKYCEYVLKYLNYNDTASYVLFVRYCSKSEYGWNHIRP